MAGVRHLIPLFRMASGYRIPPPPPSCSGCWGGCRPKAWGPSLLPGYPCSRSSWASNPVAPGKAEWETSGAGLLSLEIKDIMSSLEPYDKWLRCAVIKWYPVPLLMQDRGSVEALLSLQPNLSSVPAPAPALLDPGCADSTNINRINHPYQFQQAL